MMKPKLVSGLMDFGRKVEVRESVAVCVCKWCLVVSKGVVTVCEWL